MLYRLIVELHIYVSVFFLIYRRHNYNITIEKHCNFEGYNQFTVRMFEQYYYFQAWQDDESSIPTKPFDDDDHLSYFYIKVSAELDAEHVTGFWVPFDQLVNDDFSTSRPIVSAILSEVCVPVDAQPDMVDHIVSCAHSMAGESRNVGSMVLPMFVHIVSEDYILDDDVRDDVDDNFAVLESCGARGSTGG